jgi:hypothetical protein
MFATKSIIINLNAKTTTLTKKRKKIKIDQQNSRVDDSQTSEKILSFVNVDEIRYIDK